MPKSLMNCDPKVTLGVRAICGETAPMEAQQSKSGGQSKDEPFSEYAVLGTSSFRRRDGNQIDLGRSNSLTESIAALTRGIFRATNGTA